jgi:hypothetical protein
MPDHIVIGDIRPRVQYTADGTQTAFTYPFPIFAPADLKVYLGEALQGAGFTVNGAGQSAGGTVTFAAAPAAGTRVTLVRALAIARTTDFQEGGAFRAKTLNDELDRQTAFIQEVGERIERAIVAAPTESAAPLVLPPPALRANAYLGFDAAGTPIASPGTPPAPFSAALTPFVQAPTLTAARQILGALGNERLAKAAAYAVANADKAKTIACAGGPWTLTFDTPLAYDADFAVLVLGENDTRAIKIHFNSGGADFWLYPKQTALIYRQGSAWYAARPERWRLPGSITIYVDGTNGNNANDGLAAGVGNALASMQAASDLVERAIDTAGFTVTVQVANGTYTASTSLGAVYGGGEAIVRGDETTPANVLVSVTNDYCFKRIGPKPGYWHVRGFELRTTGGGSALFAQDGATLYFQKLKFGACASSGIGAHRSGFINATGSFEISGNMPAWIVASAGSFIDVAGAIVTLTGTPAWSGQGIYASRGSVVEVHAMTFSGTATGTRYSVESNAIIFTGGGGASYLPGNGAGGSSGGGQYI